MGRTGDETERLKHAAWREEVARSENQLRLLNRLSIIPFGLGVAVAGVDLALDPSTPHFLVVGAFLACIGGLAFLRSHALASHRRTLTATDKQLVESEERDGRLRQTLEELLGVCAATTGPDLFGSLARRLTSCCDVDFAAISAVDRPRAAESSPCRSARTVAFVSRTTTLAPYAFQLEDASCGEAFRLGFAHHHGDVIARFPRQTFLRDQHIQTYMGIAINDSQGTPIGIIGLYSRTALANPRQTEQALRAIAGRVGAELDRIAIERSLRESEARLNAMITNSPGVAMQWCDREGRILLWNRASEAIYGYTAQEAIGRKLDELIEPKVGRSSFRDVADRVLDTGESLGPAEFCFRRKSGESGVCISTAFAIPGDRRESYVACMDVEVTELRRAETAARQAQRLQAIGQLAGGIAHDFNNLLVLINGYAELLGSELGSASNPFPPERQAVQRHWIEGIIDSGRRAASLTGQLLTIGRKQALAPRVVDVDRELRALERNLNDLASPLAPLRFERLATSTTIHVDPTQLHQILLNLVVNARDAIISHRSAASAGIVIRTENVASTAEPGETSHAVMCLRLSVIDEGTGMSAEVQERMFEPFFTTKPVGKGTGLGMATVYGAVQESGGTIHVKSQVGEGTTISIEWPLADHALLDDAAAAPPSDAIAGRFDVIGPPSDALPILVVDDDVPVRRLLASVLRNAGYRVVEASSADEARQKLQALAVSHLPGTSSIRLLVTDLSMSGRGGADLARELHHAIPELRVLFVSGNAGNDLVKQGVMAPTDAFLQKPFTFTALTETVRNLLASPPASRTTAARSEADAR